MITNIKGTATGLLLAATLLGCEPGADSTAAHDHGADGHGQDTAAHGHGHGDGESLVYTDYTQATELFVEFPPLVAGQSSTFAAHVTRLSDYRPLTSGVMDVSLLTSDNRTVARFRVTEPARTGIFTPAVTPRDAGDFHLVVEVKDGDLQARHELGEVRVFADQDAAEVNQNEPSGGISYLKEQQWDDPFAAHLVSQRPLRPSVPGFATVTAPGDASAQVRAPADGYFTAAKLRTAGQTVDKDTLLGYVVPRLGQGTDVGNLMVDIEKAQAQVKLAERDVQRLRPLVDQGAVPERRLVEAQEDLDVARVELQTARRRLTQQTGNAADSGIALRAPFAGELVSANVRPGAFVRAGDVLFTLADPARRWLEVRVPEKFAGSLSDTSGAWLDYENNGERTTVVLDAANQARVVQLDTVIEAPSRTAKVTVEYASDRGPSVIGTRYPAQVFTRQAENRLALPRTAVIDDNGRPVVYVQTGGESFARRPVRLGIVDGNYVEVLSGVEAGERVVSRGAYYVKLAAASGGDEIGHGHAH